jgi:hypothetical protein
MLERGQRRDLLALLSLLGVSIANFVGDRMAILQTMVLFSSRNKFDISAWTPVPLALTDDLDPFEWPLELTSASVWMLQLPFMVLGID